MQDIRMQTMPEPLHWIDLNPQKPHSASIREIFASLWRNRGLIRQLTQREVIGRYRGSIMGMGWSLLNPLFMLTAYTFVFSVVFKARWGGDGQTDHVDFAIILFVGLIVHGLFAECINRAPLLILSNVNYVKKVLFPLEILPCVAVGSALFHALVSFAVLIAVQLLRHQALPWTALLLPLVIGPFLLMTLGFAWLLAAIGVYVRDIANTTGLVTTALMFFSPVFYPVSALPLEYRGYLALNPLTFVIEECRRLLVLGTPPDLGGCAILAAGGMAICWVGFWVFQKTRRGFADVL